MSTGMRRLRAVTEKLEEKFLRFQEEKLELEKRQRRLNKSLEDSAKDRAELAQMRRKIEAEQKKFLEEKSQFEEEVRKKTDELAQSKRALSTGHFAVLPPHVLFLAAQDEFVRAVPELNVADKASLHGISQVWTQRMPWSLLCSPASACWTHRRPEAFRTWSNSWGSHRQWLVVLMWMADCGCPSRPAPVPCGAASKCLNFWRGGGMR